MERLLKLCAPRNLLLAAAAAGLLFAGPRLERYPRRWVRQWLYPPQSGTTPGGDEIMRLAQRRDSAALARRYQAVMARLAHAQAEGFAVDALRRKAGVALQLDGPRYRRHAFSLLAEVESEVPRRRAEYIPAGVGEEDSDIPADLPGRSVGPRRR